MVPKIESALFLKSNHLACLLRSPFFGMSRNAPPPFGESRNAPPPFGEVLRDIPKAACEGDYHLASAMDSQSRTKGACIVFVDF